MAAGFWAWLCAPAAPQAAPVSAPRLHTATAPDAAPDAAAPDAAAPDAAAPDAAAPDAAAQYTVAQYGEYAAAEHAGTGATGSAPAGRSDVLQATAEAGPVGSAGDSPLVGNTLVVAGPRAPPATS
jgi:hypothetical protein